MIWGGGQNIAAQAVVKSPPDGYTLLLTDAHYRRVFAPAD